MYLLRSLGNRVDFSKEIHRGPCAVGAAAVCLLGSCSSRHAGSGTQIRFLLPQVHKSDTQMGFVAVPHRHAGSGTQVRLLLPQARRSGTTKICVKLHACLKTRMCRVEATVSIDTHVRTGLMYLDVR